MTKHTARISAQNAAAIAKDFLDIIDPKDFQKKVKLTEGWKSWTLPYRGNSAVALVKQYATKHTSNYFLVGPETGVKSFMQSHCKKDNFCFREFDFM